MILRKPYAFLIKNFKLLHAISSIFMIYVFYKTFGVLSVFGNYITSNKSLIGENIVSSVYNSLMYLFPIFIILFSLVLFGIMALKKKPSFLYIINITIYIYTFVMFIIGRSTLLELEINLVDIRVVKAIRDLTTLSMILQIYPLIKSIVRAIGFDIKQFDFGKDLANLEINETDNEEFEVNVSLDTNKMKRGVNSKARLYKYIYEENKFLINTIIIVILLVIGSFVTYGVIKANAITELNTSFSMSGFIIKVGNSYSTRKDYKGNILENLDETKSVLLVPIDVTNNSLNQQQLMTTNIELDIDGHKFRHINTYRDAVFDIGNVYDDNIFASKENKRVLLSFEIPTKYLTEKMKLKFITSIEIKNKILMPTYTVFNISSTSLDGDINKVEISNDEVIFNQSVLRDTHIKINSVDVKKTYKVDYKFCLSTSNCIDSYEYLSAKINSNIDKSLMKINGNLTVDSNLQNSSLNYLYDLFNYFARIDYTINDKNKYVISGFTKVNPTYLKSNNEIYISVPSELEQANTIKLIFRIRNYEYVYNVK